jgi:hypothetical protein
MPGIIQRIHQYEAVQKIELALMILIHPERQPSHSRSSIGCLDQHQAYSTGYQSASKSWRTGYHERDNERRVMNWLVTGYEIGILCEGSQGLKVRFRKI